jgi:hypothetical protein
VQQIDHRRPPLRIGPGRHVAARLVQQNVAVLLDDLDPPAIDANVVVRRIRLRTQLAHGDAVHRDAALEHQLLRGAA